MTIVTNKASFLTGRIRFKGHNATAALISKRFKSKRCSPPTSSQAASAQQVGSRLQELRNMDHKSTPNLDDFIVNSIKHPFGNRPTTRFEFEDYYSKIRLPVLESTTIHPEAYRSQEFFEVEKHKLFSESWQVVGHVDQLRRQGDTVIATASGQPILITCGKDSVIRGFYNVCRHRGALLVSENGRYPVISCPYHRWGYALDGRLLATPMFKGDGISENAGADMRNESAPSEAIKKAFSTSEVKNFNKKDYGLLPVRVESWGPFVFANLSENAPPLKTYLGDLEEALAEYPFKDLVSYKSRTITVNANWKLLAENFMEYYHLPSVHPELCNVSGVDNHHRAQGTGSYIGLVTYPISRGGTPIDGDKLLHMEGLTGTNRSTAWFHHLFPNAFYFLLPHSFYSVVLEPVAPGVTLEHARLLVHPNSLHQKDATKVLDEMWEFYDFVNNQDLSICEKVQLGINALGYHGGRITFRFEEPIHRFQNMVADYMTGNPKIPVGEETVPFKFQTDKVVDAA